MKIIITSGFFDPLHVGHVELFNLSKKMGDKLVVIVDNDIQTRLKKGQAFMSAEERMQIVRNLKAVDEVVLSIDKDNTYITNTLKKIRDMYPDDELIFTKGGDRTVKTMAEPEMLVCKEKNINIVYGVWEKIQSSSWLIDKVKKSV